MDVLIFVIIINCFLVEFFWNFFVIEIFFVVEVYELNWIIWLGLVVNLIVIFL